jgi:hypothetical protein
MLEFHYYSECLMIQYASAKLQIIYFNLNNLFQMKSEQRNKCQNSQTYLIISLSISI